MNDRPTKPPARVIQVIETILERRGTGEPDSPMRVIRQYWSLDGELLAEVDPCNNAIRSSGSSIGTDAFLKAIKYNE